MVIGEPEHPTSSKLLVNSILRQTKSVFHPEDVGPALIEFMQE